MLSLQQAADLRFDLCVSALLLNDVTVSCGPCAFVRALGKGLGGEHEIAVNGRYLFSDLLVQLR